MPAGRRNKPPSHQYDESSSRYRCTSQNFVVLTCDDQEISSASEESLANLLGVRKVQYVWFAFL